MADLVAGAGGSGGVAADVAVVVTVAAACACVAAYVGTAWAVALEWEEVAVSCSIIRFDTRERC